MAEAVAFTLGAFIGSTIVIFACGCAAVLIVTKDYLIKTSFTCSC